MTLAGRARKVDPKALVSQRTKRIPAIKLKLRKNHEDGFNMKLSQMHDIGGCRAIVKNVDMISKLIDAHVLASKKNSNRGHIFRKEYNYIQNPKPTGYRGVHLVYEYRSHAAPLTVYNGLKIEIQMRTPLQHYWATAVETVGFYTGQALKSNIGDLSWKRFFVLVGNEFARLEKRPLVPGAPEKESVAKKELKACAPQLAALHGFGTATKMIAETPVNEAGASFLLQLNVEKKEISTLAFGKEMAATAQETYAVIEGYTKNDPNLQTVLVSVDSLAALHRAYPSYYLDITEFIKVLNERVL